MKTDSQVKIYIAGSGKVARYFAHLMVSKGIKIHKIWSRNADKGLALAEFAHAGFLHVESEKEDKNPAFCIVAVADDAIEEVVGNLSPIFPNTCFLHCSGMFDTDQLLRFTPYVGCLYPLMSIPDDPSLVPSDPPIIYHSAQGKYQQALEILVEKLSKHHLNIEDKNRQYIHLAAVFINNFVNILLQVGHDIATSKNLDFKLLLPLAKNTIERLSITRPGNVQTGPAIRRDAKTIEKHLQLLRDYPEEYMEMYLWFTQYIQKIHPKS